MHFATGCNIYIMCPTYINVITRETVSRGSDVARIGSVVGEISVSERLSVGIVAQIWTQLI